MSADGSTVVGTSSTAGVADASAYRWTRHSGILALPAPPGGGVTQAGTISGDGRVIWGTANGNPCRWIESNNPEILALPGGWSSIVFTDASFDGGVVCGFANINGVARAFRWSASGGFISLGTFQPAESFRTSRAYAMSADGNLLFGDAEGREVEGPFRWTSASGMEYLGKPPGALSASLRCASDDGLFAAFSCTSFMTLPRAFRWQSGAGMMELPVSPPVMYWVPHAMNGDGSVIVGDGPVNTGHRMVRWTPLEGLQDLHVYLPTVGIPMPQVDSPTGWSDLKLWEISSDGLVMSGNGSLDGVKQGFVILLPSLHRVCASDLTDDGAVDDGDFVIFAGQYDLLICSTPAMPTCSADLNADGYVDDGDFVLFVRAYEAIVCP